MDDLPDREERAAGCSTELVGDDVLVYRLTGDLDMGAREALAFDVPLDALRAVVVDLADVTFFDSTALNALLRLRAAAIERQVTVHLAAPPANTARVLEITDAALLFPRHPSLASALKTLAAD
ncbi:anti-sigma B factor antagonist [Streptacidiphilus jiangxiensis]|uniref:Anti-sigma B factor antagonist n=2 Tax=Streptacidiphilus jiangxiensis TaxID=235985 RepID=A0A1H7NX97_STRJI|nr:anti-sigma B factor antagonist [Streptacidiphilus jiangxiensis]